MLFPLPGIAFLHLAQGMLPLKPSYLTMVQILPASNFLCHPKKHEYNLYNTSEALIFKYASPMTQGLLGAGAPP